MTSRARAVRTDDPVRLGPEPVTALVHSNAVADGKMTIDQLARAAGTTTRTVRSYQDRGLLPPPTIIGRTGYYDDDHLARLQVIGRLLDQRFSLASIAALFQAWESGLSLGHILGFVEELTAPYTEAPRRVSITDIQRVFPDGGARWLADAIRLGILSKIADDEFEVTSPRLLDTGATLVEAGVPIERMLGEAEQLRDDCDRIAARFVEMFITYIWQPYLQAGRPASDLKKVIDYLAITRPLPVEATSVMIAQAMQRQLDRSVADLIAAERDALDDAEARGPDPSATAHSEAG